MKKKFILIFSFLLFLISCGPSAEQLAQSAITDSIRVASNEANQKTEASMADMVSFPKNADSTRKMIRTAEIKFKVKDVPHISTQIEDLTAVYKGFITYSHLSSVIINAVDIKIEDDSLVHVQTYTFENEIRLRIPNNKLDSFLRSLVPFINYLDYRIVKADDITLNLLSIEKLTKRLDKFDHRMSNSIDDKGKKLNETIKAEDILLNRQNQADANNIDQLRLMDQYNYSSVAIYLYQNQLIRSEKLLNTRTYEDYKPGFFTQLSKAFNNGWSAILFIFIILTNLWAFILLGLIIYYLIRKYLQYKKSKNLE